MTGSHGHRTDGLASLALSHYILYYDGPHTLPGTTYTRFSLFHRLLRQRSNISRLLVLKWIVSVSLLYSTHSCKLKSINKSLLNPPTSSTCSPRSCSSLTTCKAVMPLTYPEIPSELGIASRLYTHYRTLVVDLVEHTVERQTLAIECMYIVQCCNSEAWICFLARRREHLPEYEVHVRSYTHNTRYYM